MRKKVYIPLLVFVLLLSTCYGEAFLRFNRIEEALFGQYLDFKVVNRSTYDALLPFSDRQYYFHIRMTPQSHGGRPNFLVVDEWAEDVDYYIGAFRREPTFSNSSLNLDGDLRLYRGDVTVPDTACDLYPCAVYWLEDRQHHQLFVSINSF